MLIVTCYDKLKNTIINVDNNPCILIDDTIKTIKEKLFVFGGIKMNPGFLKIEYIENNDFKLFKNNINSPINSIYISNIITELESEADVGELYIKSNDTTNFVKIVDKYKKEYEDLTIDDFYIALKIILLQSNKEFYKHFTEDITDFVTKLNNLSKSLSKKYYPLQKLLLKYYNDKPDDFDVKLETKWKNITLNILPNNYTDNKKQFIKMEQIFNVLELNNKIPFISINTIQDTPLIKIYNKLLDISTEKEIKSWILNEKKKANILSYKVIKGLYLVYNIPVINELMTVIIRNNGLIICKISPKNSKDSLEKLKKYMKDGVDYIIDTINKIPSVFLYSKRLQSTNNSKIIIDSISGECILSGIKINLNKIENIMNNEIIRKNLFAIKDILSTKLLSLNYINTNNPITVNIQDNEYLPNSSIITALNIKTEFQLNIIINHLIYLAGNYDTNLKNLKEKSHIKEIRKSGLKIFSTKCQKSRQPILFDSNKFQQQSYTVEYENNIYMCPNPDYPYPGFMADNLLCCYKLDQRNKDTYLRNVKKDISQENIIYVTPSNFTIKINNTLITQLIKSSNFENNSKYFYINDSKELIEIKNDNLLANIEKDVEDGNIQWLESVDLETLITTPPINKCKNAPLFKNGVSPCSHQKTHKIFGYTEESFPCCFKNDPNEQYKSKDVTKMYIVKSDKVLDYQRIGVMHPGLNKLFDDTYFRMGVVQNKSAFFNAILLAMSKSNLPELKTEKTFKDYIANYLYTNKNEFETLNESDIINKYKSLEYYIKSLKNNENVLYWYDFIDVIQRLLNINIIILNIPYQIADTNKETNYKNIKIICNYKIKPNNGKYLILLKRANTFEIVVNIDTNKNITYLYNNGEDIINILLNYYKISCIKEEVFPESYTFTKMNTPEFIINKLKGSPFEIVKQIKNYFNKIDYLFTKPGILIPIKESGVLKNIDFITIDKVDLKSIETYEKLLPKLSLLLGENYFINGITINESNNITSFMSNYGQLIPVLNNSNETDYKILDIKYYNTFFNSTVNQQVMYSELVKKRKNLIYNIKQKLGEKLVNNTFLKNDIVSIITSKDIPKYNKIIKIENIFKTILNTEDNIYLKIIANEVINDNIENLLLNNTILTDSFNPNFVIKRDTETILSNINDIQQWFNIFKKNNDQ